MIDREKNIIMKGRKQRRGRNPESQEKPREPRKMQSPNVNKIASKNCNCHCCLNPNRSSSISLDHQNSASITNSSTFHYDFATATTSSLYPHTQFTNHESLPDLQESFRPFTRAFPQYLNTIEADQIRGIDYSHLSLSSHVCLDYTGHTLFSSSQQQQEEEQQKHGEFMPSSSSTPRSRITQFEISHKAKGSSSSNSESEFESKLRGRIMRYLNISEDDYSMFFTANQTSAFRVLAECYPFKSNRNLLTVYDHENEAVEAMVESSRNRGARVSSAEFKWPKLKIHCCMLKEMVVGNNKKGKKMKKDKGLFVFPLQSRVSGARYSYQWMNMAQENGWHVLLDATSLGAKEMDSLGLSLFRPDFLICTFYKGFGDDPSGFSCLFVNKTVASILKDSDISSTSGIVSLIGTSSPTFLQNLGHQTVIFRDVTLHQNGIEEFNVRCRGLDHADSLGLVLIGTRTRCLVNWLVNALQTLSHPNSEKGVQLVTIYGPRVRLDRGTALAFNVFDWKGEKVDPSLVQKLADRNNISIGCGVIKHVWFSKRYEEDKGNVLEKGSRERKGIYKTKRGENCDTGIAVVTASLCFLNNFEDVYRLWEFVARFLDADFVEKERWRYTALNLRTIEV